MPFVTSSFLLLVVRPGAPSSILASSSDALVTNESSQHLAHRVTATESSVGQDLEQQVQTLEREKRPERKVLAFFMETPYLFLQTTLCFNRLLYFYRLVHLEFVLGTIVASCY